MSLSVEPNKASQNQIALLEREIAALKEDRVAFAETQHELSVTLEDLKVHREELTTQNEELLEAHERNRELHLKYRELFEFAPVGYLVLDVGGSVLDCNPKARDILGLKDDYIRGRSIERNLSYEQKKILRHHLATVFSADESVTSTTHLVLEDKEQKKKYLRVESIRSDRAHKNSASTICRMVINDITEEKVASSQLKLANRVLGDIREGMLITDGANNIIRVNSAFCEITGYRPEEVIGETPGILASGRHNDAFYQEMWNSLERKHWWSGEIWNKRKNGDVFPEWLTISRITNSEGDTEYYVAVFSDITGRKKSEQRLNQLAHYDPLTNLPNRTLLRDRVSHSLSLAKRHRSKLALLFIDLDNFKRVNDVYGHDEGDLVLRKAARRLQNCVRSSDTLSRIGGDEFVILLNDINDESRIHSIAENVLTAIKTPFEVRGCRHHVSASIGCSIFPDHADSSDALMRLADMAMYRSKRLGKNRFSIYSKSLGEQANLENLMENSLHEAMENNEFYIVYQPQVDARVGKIIAAEVLLRWRKPDGSQVSPAEFIPVAEQSDIINQLGFKVVKLCFEEHGALAEGEKLPLSINLSSRQLVDPLFIEMIRSEADKYGVDLSYMTFELTETAAIESAEATNQVLSSLRQLGAKIALDDFGTGYASLGYLQQLPIDIIKIDRAFVKSTPGLKQDEALIRAILAISKGHGIDVIAEGVETEEQAKFLNSEKCYIHQGFYYAKPMQFEDLMQLVKKSKGNGK